MQERGWHWKLARTSLHAQGSLSSTVCILQLCVHKCLYLIWPCRMTIYPINLEWITNALHNYIQPTVSASLLSWLKSFLCSNMFCDVNCCPFPHAACLNPLTLVNSLMHSHQACRCCQLIFVRVQCFGQKDGHCGWARVSGLDRGWSTSQKMFFFFKRYRNSTLHAPSLEGSLLFKVNFFLFDSLSMKLLLGDD